MLDPWNVGMKEREPQHLALGPRGDAGSALPSGTPLRLGGKAETVTPTAKGNLQSALNPACKDSDAVQKPKERGFPSKEWTSLGS